MGCCILGKKKKQHSSGALGPWGLGKQHAGYPPLTIRELENHHFY